MRKHWALLKRFGFDALIVVGAATATVEMIVKPGEELYHPTASLWFLIPAALVTVLALLARRFSPFGAPAATLVLAAAISFYEGNFAPVSFSIFLAVIASAFLLGLSGGRQALAGLPIIIAAVLIVVRNDRNGSADDFVFVTIILSCAWLAGFALDRRLQEAHRLEALASEREEQAQRAVEDERNRIARELHDVIAHSVSVMTVQAGAVRRLLAPEQQREREALLTVEETGRQALTEMRRLLGVLRRGDETVALAPQPGLATLEHLVQQVREAGLPVEVTFEGERISLPPGIDLSAYRIVQEALTNALKHAGPARAWVVVRYGADQVEVEVANDGRSNGSGDGYGLIGMRERVASCGGNLTAGPRAGGGYTISARLPVAGSAA